MSLAYTGQLHPGQGLYRSEAFTAQGTSSVLLVTQLESQGARWLLPCYDHPAAKACPGPAAAAPAREGSCGCREQGCSMRLPPASSAG